MRLPRIKLINLKVVISERKREWSPYQNHFLLIVSHLLNLYPFFETVFSGSIYTPEFYLCVCVCVLIYSGAISMQRSPAYSFT